MVSRLKAVTLSLPGATTWLAWLLPVFAWAPLTYPGYFEFHSGFLPIFNLNNLTRHLGDLSWAPAIGQPYDLLRGEGALPYLLALLPRALGASGAAAVKWVFAASILLGAVGMYGWARRRLGAWPSLLASVIYAFWPLGLATIYVRGAFAEALLLGLMPWALWAADAAVGATANENLTPPAPPLPKRNRCFGRGGSRATPPLLTANRGRQERGPGGEAVFRTDAHAARRATSDENAWSTLSGAPPVLSGAQRSRSIGGAQSKGAGMSSDAPASFDSVRQTTPDSAQDASAGILVPGTSRAIFRPVGPAVGLALALAAALWTQAGLALWLAGLVLGYILALKGFRPVPAGRVQGYGSAIPVHQKLSALLGWLGGLALGALGLLPLLLRRGLGGGGWPAFADHLVYPHQLLLAGWGLGPSIPGPDDTLTFQLGLVACGLAVLGIVMEQRQESGRAGERENRRDLPLPHSPAHLVTLRQAQGRLLSPRLLVYLFPCLLVLTLSLLSTTLAAPLWRILPFLARTLTYPWQLLLLAGPWLAWLAGLGGRTLLGISGRGGSVRRPATAPGAIFRTVPLFAGLIALALLGSYGDLQPPATSVPVADAPVAVFGDDEILLLSAVPAGAPGPGGQITLLARWQAARPLSQDYTVFFHVETPDGAVWGQQDTMPQGGQLPTSRWRPGQVVTDQYQVRLKPDAPAGADYRYLLGLYQWQTGQRLRAGADNKVVVTP